MRIIWQCGVFSLPVLHVFVLKEGTAASGQNPAQDVAVRQQRYDNEPLCHCHAGLLVVIGHLQVC